MARVTNREALNNARADILDILNDLEATISRRTKVSTSKTSNTKVKTSKPSNTKVKTPKLGNTKANVVQMIKAGKSFKQILAANPSFTRGQVSAFKAHITMGNL